MKKSSIALGFFDGVHIAHTKIINCAVNFAKENGLSPIALTFDKSPLEILAPEKVSYITNREEKASLIKDLGAEPQFLRLSRECLSMSPEEFVRDVLIGCYNISHAVCGYNYHFGKNGDGDTDTLLKLGEKYGFTVEVCDKVTYCDTDVSSSKIRSLIAEGNIALANALLGRNYTLCGIVVEGKHLGKELGFPTANVFFGENAVTPLCGVYKTITEIDGVKMPSVTNVGVNPTVGGEKMRSETFISGFSANIYGKKIKIEFVNFIRRETRFESLDELKKQIAEDISLL